MVGLLELRENGMTDETQLAFRHLLALCRALRTAQMGNLATGERPDKEAARRLTTALDVCIATHERRELGKQHEIEFQIIRG